MSQQQPLTSESIIKYYKDEYERNIEIQGKKKGRGGRGQEEKKGEGVVVVEVFENIS